MCVSDKSSVQRAPGDYGASAGEMSMGLVGAGRVSKDAESISHLMSREGPLGIWRFLRSSISATGGVVFCTFVCKISCEVVFQNSPQHRPPWRNWCRSSGKSLGEMRVELCSEEILAGE